MDNLHIVNLASYNRPKISEDKQKDWVNYGEDNDYYSYCIWINFFSKVTRKKGIRFANNVER